MTDDQGLGNALVGEMSPTDAAALTARVLARDRRRIRLLGVACVIAWMAVVMLPWATVLPMIAKVVEHQSATDGPPTTAPAGGVAPGTREMLHAVRWATQVTFLFSLGSMLVAAVLTVSLILASRRATLRQVNARLAEISAHLQELRRATR